MHRRTAQLLKARDIDILKQTLRQRTRFLSRSSQKSESLVCQDEAKSVTKVTEQLLNAASRSRILPSSGWKHKRSLRGEEKRLEEAVRTTPVRPPTRELAAWQEAGVNATMDEAVEDFRAGDIPALGTYVDIRRGLTSASGIVLGHALVDNRNYILTLSLSGDVLTHYVADIFFEVPQMVPRELAARAGITQSPNRKTEICARVEILQRLRTIERLISQSYCAIGSRNIALYPRVRPQSPDEWSTVTVPQAARFITDSDDMNPYNLLATHRYLMNHTIEFVPHFSSHRTTQVWSVRPQSHVDKLVAVTNMIHESNPAIDSFVSKARTIMAANRKRSEESWNEHPTQELNTDTCYTREDRMIVDVLNHSLHARRHIRADPYSPVVTTILKKLEVAELIDNAVLHRVLIDLGHLAPWDDLVSRWLDLGLDQHPEEKSPKVVTEDRIVQENTTRMAAANAHDNDPLGPEDLYLRDPAEHLRHDFGDLPVYVVDDIGAEELDDGLSIEPIPSEPGAAWIHVHVADPTAIIPPTHIFAQEARKMGSTAYFVHRSWPMLPKSLTLSKMSLGSNLSSGQPERVLTFSFKIDDAGNMADYQVRAGLVRNIVTVDYDSVDHLLGSIRNHESFRPFDTPGLSSPLPVMSLSAKHISNLRFITEAISRHRQRNLASSNYFYTAQPRAKITVNPKPLIGTPLDCPDPYRFRGFPSLAYEVVGQQMQSSGSRMVIAECMKAACRVASCWSLDRRVPMLRRSSKPPVCLEDPQAVWKLLAMREEDGFVDFYAVQKSRLFIPPVEHTLEPAMHWSMGIPDGEGYIRVTSPLRRYSDLVAHWQIKHALLNPGTTKPLFSSTWLQEYAPEIKQREKEYKRVERLNGDFWSYLYIKRFMEDPWPAAGRHDPLRSLKATVSSVRLDGTGMANSFICYIPTLGVSGILPASSSKVPGVGDVVKVRVKAVELGPQPQLHLSLRNG